MSVTPHPVHFRACPSRRGLERVGGLAESLGRRYPRLGRGREFPRLATEVLRDAPTLHLDDFSDITLPEARGSIEFLQDRARLRAGDGDAVVTTVAPVEGYEEYCRDRLGLGSVRWLRARAGARARHLATTCWVDPEIRRELIGADFHYLHPHMGSFAVWALADLVQRASKRPLSVIAPPPSLTRAVNNKLWFAEVAAALLGRHSVPKTLSVGNYVSMAHAVRQLGRGSSRLVIKLTDSVGGGGNLVLDADRFEGLSLGEIRSLLEGLLTPLQWKEDREILVGSWETEVLSAPSVQLWIPPLEVGEPEVDGLFDQVIEGREGYFVGNRPARLPDAVAQPVVDRSWLLASLFQRLGYVGRCSFDLILVGATLDSCRVELVECNGRWGGTSLPMTLMTRLFGDWHGRAFACIERRLPAEHRRIPLDFPALSRAIGNRLYDHRTGAGELILYNPAAWIRGSIEAIGLGPEAFDDPRRIRLVEPADEPAEEVVTTA